MNFGKFGKLIGNLKNEIVDFGRDVTNTYDIDKIIRYYRNREDLSPKQEDLLRIELEKLIAEYDLD